MELTLGQLFLLILKVRFEIKIHMRVFIIYINLFGLFPRLFVVSNNQLSLKDFNAE